MSSADDIVRRARAVFGDRLRGVFAFGSRVAGAARADSDLDLGVWLEGPLRRGDSWIPWIEEFEREEPRLDPTFLTDASFQNPGSWLLEAVHGGVDILFDPNGELRVRLDATRQAIASGRYRRKLFMGLPYYAAEAS
jgi:hypothetical protein